VQPDNGPKQMTNEELTALWLEDPRKAYEALRTEEQQREMAKHEAVREKMDKLKSVAPDLTDYAIDITEVMKERDGFDEAYIKGLAENIDKLPPDMIYSYYDRARQHREIKSLKKEIESLKAKPARILDKIDKAQRAQFVTGSSGQTNPEGIMATTNIGDMSDKQLTEALRQRGIRI
jgi:hypothetical protein